jgi:galactofuranosylgalactofuranosylrhamnosyl-N-acetylglucosaminyl-diphospho-decaprenol beta-1,5/1,6-galactofuranosyltransferase
MSEHAAADRLVVARGLFTGVSTQVPDEMYTRIRGRGNADRTSLHLEKGARASTDTYFGRLPVSYFQRWTRVSEFQLKLAYDAVGSARVLLRGCDAHGVERTVTSAELDGAGVVTLTTGLNEYVDGGALWMECKAVGGPLKITDLEWTVAAPQTIRPAMIAMTTFNRADECAAALAAIASDKGLLAGVGAVYLVDQGTDVITSRPLFTEVAAQLGDKLVYLRQPNLGGSGGFTRGIYEITHTREPANVILMDDDILCEPESLLRLNAFANLTATPAIIGAQMLMLRNTRRLHIQAERADMKRLSASQMVPYGMRDIDMIDHRQNKRVDAQYNAWWSCLIPAEVIEAVGLPLPLFFTWDDIEYSVRAGRAGFPTVSLPNAGVWHAEFHLKDRDDIKGYFGIRNALITYALHFEMNVPRVSWWLSRKILENLVSMQYGLAYTMMRGVEDYLAGPSVLHDGGITTLAGIRADRATYPETIVRPAVEIPSIAGALVEIAPPHRQLKSDKLRIVLHNRFLRQWTGRTRGGPVAIPAESNSWWHVGMYDYAVVTDASQSGVRVRRRDKDKLVKLTWRLLRLLYRFSSQATKVQAQWREALPALSGTENWERLFGDSRVVTDSAGRRSGS